MVAERKRVVRKLRPSQWWLIKSQHPEALLSGAFGSGKSTAICEKALMHSVNYPGNRGAIFRKTGKSVRATTMVTLLLGDPPRPPVIPPGYIRHVNRADSIITFKNGSELREVIKKIPLDRILVETDCPFLTPMPFRGRRNEPAYVKFTALKLAEVKGLPLDEVARITSKNAKKAFRLNEEFI